ncbi:helix-turn-helix domain-containing protein [Ruminococcaceae bacterium OttesenSCG-928-A11]|nr:helix-turn-helix domain-containing protein [Ruminococcaceae bacterium OttesenSCG-928-A11]
MFEKYDDVVTVEELCGMLKIGRNNAYALVNSGKIKSVRIGKQIRIPKVDVIRYLSNDSCIKTESPKK